MNKRHLTTAACLVGLLLLALAAQLLIKPGSSLETKPDAIDSPAGATHSVVSPVLGSDGVPPAATPAAIDQIPEGWVKYSTHPTGSNVRIEGDSTIHEWAMEGKIITGSFELAPRVQFDPGKPTLSGVDGKEVPAKVQVSIPVRSIHALVKLGASTMDRRYLEAMNEARFPSIEYRLVELTVTEGVHEPGQAFELDSVGELAVAGTTNKVSMPVEVHRVDDRTYKISGSVPLKMTALGVEPPVLEFLGAEIQTADEVTVRFEWLVSGAAQPAKSERRQ